MDRTADQAYVLFQTIREQLGFARRTPKKAGRPPLFGEERRAKVARKVNSQGIRGALLT